MLYTLRGQAQDPPWRGAGMHNLVQVLQALCVPVGSVCGTYRAFSKLSLTA